MIDDRAFEHPFARDVVGECLFEQIVEIEHLDAAIAQRVGKRVVLVARPLDPQHVVEQEIGAVRRSESLELDVGPVQHHTAAACRPPSRHERPVRSHRRLPVSLAGVGSCIAST